MPELSVVIITFNEESNVERCLESIQNIADEIVVVDSYSSDNTRLICEKYGARFIEHDFEGYIEQRNFASTQATFSHQLALDADEALSEELKNGIRRIKENWEYDGYRMNRLANYCGKWIWHSGWYPDTKLRLYDVTKGEYKGVNPHGKFIMHQNTSIGFVKGNLLHYTYYSIKEHMERSDRYSTIAAREFLKQGKPIYYSNIIINPAAKFIRNYLFRLGFLDGYYGFQICRIMVAETYQKYRKAIRLKRLNGKDVFHPVAKQP
jgi:glycosyltransferase involved in cell wall biosynthesis